MHLLATTPRSRALTAAALVALLVVACGDDDDGGDGDTTTTSSPAAATSTTAADDATTTTGGATTTAGESGEGATVSIAEFAFDPETVTVPVGTTVTWTNEDDVAHTTAAEDGAWDSGDLAGGESFDTVLDEPGTYAYFCGIHNFMQGEIVVE